MKPSFSDLSPEQQATYGNGCGVRFLKVPDFVFTASCRHHDFNFERGSGTWYKAPYYYMKANTDFYVLMLRDSVRWYHPIIATVYYLAVTLFSWPRFSTGRWRTVQEILERDRQSKLRDII